MINLIPYIDLTSLNDTDNDQSISVLCEKAFTPKGNVAAVCIYSQFIALAKDLLEDKITLATVCNFPTGNQSIEDTCDHIENALAQGANEIDVVLPYEKLLAGDTFYVKEFLQACRDSTKDNVLKVIIESGELKTTKNITTASELAIDAGANFVKTSTGKTEHGASLDAATSILNVIKHHPSTGIKISGGVRTIKTADEYYHLIADTMGEDWITPMTFRIGASGLLDKLLLL